MRVGWLGGHLHGQNPGMPISVSARRTGGPLRCEVSLPGDRTVVTDEPEDLGGEDSAPTPQQLLAAALASCVATTIQMYASRKGWELDDVRVDVEYHLDPRPRCASVSLHLPEGLSDEQRERLHQIASRCPVSRALVEGVEVSEPVPT
jgi:putative redox protein